MSYFDDASLVMIPSGYKTSKVYSVKPTDGTGDLTFTRSNDTATRVGPDGLIEKVRTNLFTYSEQFDNAAWTKALASVTANSAANPLNGASTAENVVPNTTSGGHFISQAQSVTAGVPFTISIYAKANGYDWIYLFADGSGSGQYQVFNVSNGTLGLASGTATKTITAVGGGWYRCTLSWVPSVSGSINFQIAVLSSNSVAAYAGNGTSGVLFYGTQLETGDIATDYIATTTAAVSVGPVANVPRLDYLNSSCPRLLLEPQRTNLVTYSEQFNNAYYALNNATITANSVVSPDGYTNADTYTATGGGNYIIGGATSTGSNTITYSVFAKAGTQNVFRIREAFYFGSATIFNLSTGTVTSGTGTITSYGNGWYRCTHTQAYGAGETNVSVIFDTTASSGTFYLYGAQFEVGAYATSYIPTLGAAVTRGADAASKTGISSLIGQTEGVLFVELAALSGANDSRQICINDGTTSNRVTMAFLDNGTQMQFVVQSGGSITMNTTQNVSGLTNGAKIAYAYKLNDFAVYVNGSLLATDTNGAVPVSMSALNFDAADGTDKFFGKVNQTLLFNTRLTNAQLAELTTL